MALNVYTQCTVLLHGCIAIVKSSPYSYHVMFILAVECKDKGVTFCRRYAPYCKQIKEGGPYQAFMKINCCNSCSPSKIINNYFHACFDLI